MRLNAFAILMLASSRFCVAQDIGDFKPAPSNVLDVVRF